jgi:hypothetical protein
VGDESVDVRSGVKRVLDNYAVKMWNGLNWLRVESNGGSSWQQISSPVYSNRRL